MPRGSLQLIYVGQEDIYLTANPQITFFKTVYKRHTNFAIDTVQENFNNKINFGQQIRCKLSKNGDLLSSVAMHIRLSGLNENRLRTKCMAEANCLCTCPKCLYCAETDDLIYGYVNSIGHVLLEQIEVWIGGNMISRSYGEALQIFSELEQTAEKRNGFYEMIGKKDNIAYTVDSFTDSMDLIVPFDFWFCKNIGLALPVMSLIYHDVEFVIKIRDFNQCWVCNQAGAPYPKAARIDAYLMSDYVYLAIDERRKFYSQSHIYLIEQIQVNENNHLDHNTGMLNIDLYFNNPVKELVWFVQRQDVLGHPDGVYCDDCSYPVGNDHYNYTSNRIQRIGKLRETFDCAKLQFSGIDRTVFWPAALFRLWENYKHHTRIPTGNYIYTYSFALKPEEHQPTSTANFSRIDSARLCIKLHQKHPCGECYAINAKIYARGYNILLVTGGMCGLLFQ